MSELTFEYTQNDFKMIANKILDMSHQMGATSASLQITESIDKYVGILNNNIENFEINANNSMSLTVYIGHNRGNVNISKIKLPQAQEQDFIQHALDIAKNTQADQYNGIAEAHLLCKNMERQLELFHPISLSNQQLIETTKDLESRSLNIHERINTSDGAAVSYTHSNFLLATTNNFVSGYSASRYAKSINLIGKSGQELHLDSWSDASRNFNNLLANQDIAYIAVKRILRRLNKGTISTGTYPVIFETSIAQGLIAKFLAAINGNNLYRKLSFLNDSLNQKIFPEWITIVDDPFIKQGNASEYFDGEGVSVMQRDLVKNGKINSYLLNCYCARKMHMESTGHASGYHNVHITTNFDGGIEQLATTMGRGLIIIETIGSGLNMVSGDYSVGASGLWVENGSIQFFVNNITIAGNLRQIYNDILHISNDYSNHDAIHCGSILVKQINVAV